MKTLKALKMAKRFLSKKPSKIGLEAKTCEIVCFSRTTRSQKHPFALWCQEEYQPFYNIIIPKILFRENISSSLFLSHIHLLNLKKKTSNAFNIYLYTCLRLIQNLGNEVLPIDINRMHALLNHLLDVVKLLLEHESLKRKLSIECGDFLSLTKVHKMLDSKTSNGLGQKVGSIEVC